MKTLILGKKLKKLYFEVFISLPWKESISFILPPSNSKVYGVGKKGRGSQQMRSAIDFDIDNDKYYPKYNFSGHNF